MASPIHDHEQDALYGLPAAQALRLAVLRIAADLVPRLTGGAKAQDVVERARILELYVAGPPPGSAEASGPADPERGAPEPTDSESHPEG